MLAAAAASNTREATRHKHAPSLYVTHLFVSLNVNAPERLFVAFTRIGDTLNSFVKSNVHAWLFAAYMVPTDSETMGARSLTSRFRFASHLNVNIMSCSAFSKAGSYSVSLPDVKKRKAPDSCAPDFLPGCQKFVVEPLHTKRCAPFPLGTFRSHHLARRLKPLNGGSEGCSSMPFPSVDVDPSASGDLNSHSADLRTGIEVAERVSRSQQP